MNIRRKELIRYTITGKAGDEKRAFDYCQKRRLRIVRAGPMPIAGYRYDVNRFKIVAEGIGEQI